MKVTEHCDFPGCGQVYNGPRHFGIDPDHEPCMPQKEQWGSKRTAIAPRSDKMVAFYAEERVPLALEVLARDGYICQLRTPAHKVTSESNPMTVHEVKTRGRHGGIRAPGVNVAANCKAACQLCNGWASEHPQEAEAMGILE